MNPNFRNFTLWVIIFLLVLALVTQFGGQSQRGPASNEKPYSQLLTDIDQGRVKSITVSGLSAATALNIVSLNCAAQG